MAETVAPPEIIARLRVFFHRNGCVRRTSEARRALDGLLYKKGSEVRLVAETRRELAEIRRLLKGAGFKTARPFEKQQGWVQPLYGVAEVNRFVSLVGERRKRRKPRKAAAPAAGDAQPGKPAPKVGTMRGTTASRGGAPGGP